MSAKSQLVTDIVGFLEQAIAKGEIAEDEKESMELAIDCIRDSFQVSDSAKPGDLLAIYERGLAGAKPASGSASASAQGHSASTASTAQAGPASDSAATAVPEVSEEVKAEADALKAKGNKLMGQRDFKGAADAYSEAILKNPGNPLYYSNRAAAFTHLNLNSRAVDDARKATELDPGYSKAWSRLGLALWAQGDVKGSLDAYEAGLKAEGDSPSEAMKRDYENVKKRYDEEMAKSSLEKTKEVPEESVDSDSKPQGPGMGGNFDFGQLSSLMSNPQIQQMAKSLMSNPSALGNLMNSPMAKQMKDQMGGGGMPDFSQLSKMMENKDMQDFMKDFK